MRALMTPERRRHNPGEQLHAAPAGRGINRPDPPIPREDDEPSQIGSSSETGAAPRVGGGFEPDQLDPPLGSVRQRPFRTGTIYQTVVGVPGGRFTRPWGRTGG